jgi:hypothetical protein
MTMNYRPTLNGPEVDAVLAGLRMLRRAVEEEKLSGYARSIYTNCGGHEGLSVDDIDILCERIDYSLE